MRGKAGDSVGRRREGKTDSSPSKRGNAPVDSPVERSASLQRTAGNRIALQLLQGGRRAQRVRPTLKIGPSNDHHEEEADRAADEIVGLPEAPPRPEGIVTRLSEVSTVRRFSDTAPPSSPDVSVDQFIGEGEALPESVRSYFAPRFGRDLREVRVHHHSRAAAFSESLRARAFTIGRDVFFGTGEYAPGTIEGKRLIAHELAHVFQQKQAPAMIQRKIKFDTETYIPINPIERILGDLPVGYTTPTANGTSFPNDFMKAGEILFQALQPKTSRYDPKTKECSFDDFDVIVSANVIVPTDPGKDGWSMTLPGVEIAGRAECRDKKSVPVTMIGKPDHDAAKKWIDKNEGEHVDDLKKLYRKYIKPHFDWLTALKVKSDDGAKCGEVLLKGLGNKDAIAIRDFLKDLIEAVKKRDAGGKHSLSNKITVKKDCSSIEIESKKK